MTGNPMRARDVARWFIAWAENIDASISNLKLQKLLYYAQGHHLARTQQPLFSDEIQAWAHGPVVPDVYHEYKHFGSNGIDADQVLDDTFTWDDYKEIQDCLLETWDTYGSLAAWALRDKTHTEPPWREAFEEGAGRNNVITTGRLFKFFTSGT
ncbi:type II toxin-antitoxin system antitoxin SocA domain-containing protein [Nocardia sp. NPDC005366]|uniref:Panacea domain-containing protein n=1 Tax=Nocardia sp. NPDC005366 TaxID=3156878 RepID=UPI0033BA1032